MRVEFVDPFVSAGFVVLQTLVQDSPERGSLSMRALTFTTQQVTIVTGVNGEVEGTVLYGMSLVTAQKISSAMMGQTIQMMDDMAWSAISELGNMITGNAAQALYDSGYKCDITPPSTLRGLNIEVSTVVPALVVPMGTKFGRVEINVALSEVSSRAKAA
ncbi:MAG: chemotaxis protein CheX [Armatimonadota bacterium]